MVRKDGQVRVRFAPSPTGYLHIGNLRVALFNWLFARHNNGVFLIRIEDTDLERSCQEYISVITEALRWVKLTSDDPVVCQSQRSELYNEAIQKLLKSGAAYWSDPANEENGISVLRFRIPRDRGVVTFDDLIRGPVSFDVRELDDFVIARADGSPLYNFVVVVDDAAMKITHVIRGEDHISNTPRQILLYEALGLTPPKFAHLPLILGPSGAKLSKRDATTSVLDYRAQGFLPDALCNYLVRLGWAYKDQEIFTREELIELFTLEGVHKSGAIFDIEKLRWMNGMYIRAMSASDLLSYSIDYIDPSFSETLSGWTQEQVYAALDLYKMRALTVVQLRDEVIHLHSDPSYATFAAECPLCDKSRDLIQEVRSRMEGMEEFTQATTKDLIRTVCDEHGVGLGVLCPVVRYAVVGTKDSPSIFAIMAILGKDKTLGRIKRFETFLKKDKGV